MKSRRKWQALAMTSAASLALFATAALGTGAEAAGSLTKCGSKVVTIQVPTGVGTETTPFKEAAKNIEAGGLSCAAAFKFVKLQLTNRTQTIPEHFKCKIATTQYKEPRGFFAERCTHNGAVVVYGQQGG